MENLPHQSPTTGVVIPAFNEAENLFPVLRVVCDTEWVKEIVVVDDGSADETSQIAKQFADRDPRIVVIRLPVNQGKGAAMLTGVRALQTDLVIFLDADLVGLTPLHLYELRSQIRSSSHEMAVAIFQVGWTISNMPQHFIPQLSGQRCLWRREAEEALAPLAEDRYAVETGLTIHARHHRWKIRKIVWRGVTHHLVWQKLKVKGGLHNRWQMYSQIVTVIARNRRSRRFRTRWVRFSRKNRLPLR